MTMNDKTDVKFARIIVRPDISGREAIIGVNFNRLLDAKKVYAIERDMLDEEAFVIRPIGTSRLSHPQDVPIGERCAPNWGRGLTLVMAEFGINRALVTLEEDVIGLEANK